MRSSLRHPNLVSRSILVFGSLCIISVFLVIPFELGKSSAQIGDRKPRYEKQSRPQLDVQRRLELRRLYERLRAGEAFSVEETNILNRFDSGEAVTEVEADAVISRGLYNYYVLGGALTREQESMLDAFASSVSRREHDIADLKLQQSNPGAASSSKARLLPNGIAPPPNDLCPGAEVIPPAGPFPYLTSVTADVTDATTTGDPAIASCTFMGGPVSRSIWYTFTPSATATYTLSTCASTPTGTTLDDTVIGIYTSTGGCAGPFTEVPTSGNSDGCDDDSCVVESLQSILTTQLTSGTQYFIVIWQFDTPAPTAGNTAVQLSLARFFAPANDTCGSVSSLTLNTPVSGTTLGSANDYQLSGAACFTGVGQTSSTAVGGDVVYSFTAPTAGDYSFRVTNYITPSNLVLYAASSCPAGSPPITVGTCLGAANRSAASSSEEVMCLPLAASQQVFIFVDENALTSGSNFTVEVNRCTRETEPNGTPATAGAIPFGLEGSVTPAADADFFDLGTLLAGSRVFSLVDGVAGNSTDFDLRVTTATDTLEYDDLNNDAPFGSLASNVGGTPLTGVQSFLRVNHFSATTQAEPYRLYTVIQPAGSNPNCNGCSATDESEPNNTTAQANTAPNSFFYGSLAAPAPSTDVDLFSFNASAGDLIFLSLDGDPARNNTPINGALALLDAGGAVLVSVSDGGSTSNTTSGAGSLTATTPSSPAEGLIWRATTTGTYFARVIIGTTSTTGTGAGDYLLSISRNGQNGPSAANGIVSGRITTSSGAPVAGAVVNLTGTQTRKTITDANGNYRFDRVETNGFYTVTPSRANFGFSPANRSFSQLSERTEASFTAAAFAEAANPIDTVEYFVRQQYVDILGREPDEGGFNYWSERILECGSEPFCVNNRRRDVAAAFFIEQEFQQTGSFIYDVYKGALGRRPVYSEYSADRRLLVGGATLEADKAAFAQAFVQRAEFLQRYQSNLTAESFVDALLANVQQSSGVDLSSQRDSLVSRYNSGTNQIESRSLVLRDVADSSALKQAEYNSAFVLTEYFGYLQRDPDLNGYLFWLDVLNNRVPGNYGGMVCAFITSAEYQRRFSTIVSRSNADCGQ